MKKTQILMIVALMFGMMACDDDTSAPLECTQDDLVCTEIFITLTFSPLDDTDSLQELDNYYSQNLDNGNIYNFSNLAGAGNIGGYIYITDAQLEEVKSSGTTIRFIGEKDGVIVVEEDFVVGHDCCHVQLIEGPLED